MYSAKPQSRLSTTGSVDIDVKEEKTKEKPPIQQTTQPQTTEEKQFERDLIKDDREFDHATYWTSFCFKLDRRAVAYFTQLTISIVILAFCIYMLCTNDDCVTFSRWSPLLSFVIGLNFPQPRLKD